MNTQNKGCMVREGFLEEVAPQKTLALHLFLGQYSVEKRREGSWHTGGVEMYPVGLESESILIPFIYFKTKTFGLRLHKHRL